MGEAAQLPREGILFRSGTSEAVRCDQPNKAILLCNDIELLSSFCSPYGPRTGSVKTTQVNLDDRTVYKNTNLFPECTHAYLHIDNFNCI